MVCDRNLNNLIINIKYLFLLIILPAHTLFTNTQDCGETNGPIYAWIGFVLVHRSQSIGICGCVAVHKEWVLTTGDSCFTDFDFSRIDVFLPSTYTMQRYQGLHACSYNKNIGTEFVLVKIADVENRSLPCLGAKLNPEHMHECHPVLSYRMTDKIEIKSHQVFIVNESLAATLLKAKFQTFSHAAFMDMLSNPNYAYVMKADGAEENSAHMDGSSVMVGANVHLFGLCEGIHPIAQLHRILKITPAVKKWIKSVTVDSLFSCEKHVQCLQNAACHLMEYSTDKTSLVAWACSVIVVLFVYTLCSYVVIVSNQNRFHNAIPLPKSQ